jgi:hypothetical protein
LSRSTENVTADAGVVVAPGSGTTAKLSTPAMGAPAVLTVKLTVFPSADTTPGNRYLLQS